MKNEQSNLGFKTMEIKSSKADVVVLYHSKDLDGYCSGAIAKRYWEKVMGKTVECIGVDYGDINMDSSLDHTGMTKCTPYRIRRTEELLEVVKDRIVVLTDMSYDMYRMVKIVENCRRFI